MNESKTVFAINDAIRNFSEIMSAVSDDGVAIITDNNIPKYAVINFHNYEKLKENSKTFISNKLIGVLSNDVDEKQSRIEQIEIINKK